MTQHQGSAEPKEPTEPRDRTEPAGPAGAGGLSRRRALVAGGTAIAAGLGATALGATASAAPSRTRDAAGAASAPDGATAAAARARTLAACYQLTAEVTEGPYYIDADKIRADVREDREGIPMTLALTVIDAETCDPVPQAAVDIWHCDALGVYSGFQNGGGGGPGPTVAEGVPTDDSRFLRGTQLTDDAGHVEFTTVFPGWYQGRAVHIHTKVHVDGTMTDSGYEGGHTCHTGQFFFAEDAVLASAEVDPYSTSTTQRTTLDEDGTYDGGGTSSGLLALDYDPADIAAGVTGTITMGVAPSETHDG